MRLLQSTVSCAVSWCKWAWMLTAVDLHWFIPPEALTWWATNISSVSLETQLMQPGSHRGGRICTSATCVSLVCGLCSVQEMNRIDMVTELFLSSLLSPLSKSTPRRKQFSPGEGNVVHPNTASRNNHPREWFPQQLKIWPNTFFSFSNEICYNFTIPGMVLNVSSTAEPLPDSQEEKGLKIKAKLSTLIMVADLKANEKEHQAAGTGQKRHQVSTHGIFLPAIPGACCLQSVMSVVC